MFKNRKKSSAKRPDNMRERDNSGVLDQYDSEPAAAPAPFRCESLTPGNFQYLKLTGGFNIVLSSDTADSQVSCIGQQMPSSTSLTSFGQLSSEENQSNSAESAEDERKSKSKEDVLGDKETESESHLQRKREIFHGPRAGVVRVTSSITDTTLPSSLPPRGQSKSLELPAILKIHGSEYGSLPVKPSSRAVRADHSHTSEEDPSVMFDVRRAAIGRVLGHRPEDQQMDKRVDKAGGLTRNTQEAEGQRNYSAKVETAHKHASLTSRRGASNNPPVLTPLEWATHADRTHSLDVNDNSAARESKPGLGLSAGAAVSVQEPNKATQPTFISNTPAEQPVEQQRSSDHNYYNRNEKLDIPESTASQSGLIHSDNDADKFAFHARPVLVESVSQKYEKYLCADTVNTGHETTAGSRSKSAHVRENLIGFGRKKTSVKITDDVNEAGKRNTATDMFRLNRHTLASKADPSEKPAVYRKLDDPGPEHADHTDTHTTSSSCAPTVVVTETTDPVFEHTPQKTPPLSPHSLASHSPTSARSAPPTPVPKPRRKSAVERVYENWTTNQAFTQVVDRTLDDDDDDGDEVDCDDISANSSSSDRHSAQGSKDSGLCVDAQGVTVFTPETGSDDSSGGDGGGGSGDDGALTAGEDDATVEGVHNVGEAGTGPDTVNTSSNALEEDESAIYQNTAVLPRPGEDGYSCKGSLSSSDGSHSSANMAPRSHHHDSDSLASHPSEDSKRNISASGGSSCDEDTEDMDGEADKGHQSSALENMHKMRQLLVRGVLDTEKTYLAILELLLHYKRTLEASCRTSQPVISEEDIGHIFSNLQQLRDVHKTFVEGLQARVDAWSSEQTVGSVFLGLVEEFPKFGAYAENYQTAVTTIHKCSQDNHSFQELAEQIVLTSTTREVTSLEDALFKPVQRLQRNTLVLYDLIKHTPKGHRDEETLQSALQLSQKNLENFGTSLVPRAKVEQKAELVKGSFLVELVGTSRKLRYIFVFSDLLVCTKRRQENRGSEVTFDCKWFIPMNLLQLDTKFTYQDDKFSKRDEIEDVKKKLRSVKSEIRKEFGKEDKQRPASSLVPSRTVEKLQRKANELECQLILSSPRLPFKVWHERGKVHTFLMTSDYERQEWREQLSSLRHNSACSPDANPPSAFDVQEMVHSVSGVPEINEIGSTLVEAEEETIYGTLNVTVHKLIGLTEPWDTYCCLEIDSYGHFFMKARTHISSSTSEPSWNEDFELDLEGSQTLCVLCYRKGSDKQGDNLLCRGALELNKEWLKDTFEEKIITMNEYSLVLSMCYTDTDKTLCRTPVRQSGTAVFGIPIGTCATRESKTVPTIITACVQEVEKRGMKETGIYRVSGVTSDVQRLKKLFDKNLRAGVTSLSEVDIHTVTSLLKLYLRELPDPVFTEASYSNFLDVIKLNDKEGKEKCMLSLFHNLPDINYYTAVYLLEHLLRVCRHEEENKMGVHNLSTIFGPTLLAPAPDTLAVSVTELMTQGAEHCMKQSQVVYYYLNLLTSGASLRRSSAVVT